MGAHLQHVSVSLDNSDVVFARPDLQVSEHVTGLIATRFPKENDPQGPMPLDPQDKTAPKHVQSMQEKSRNKFLFSLYTSCVFIRHGRMPAAPKRN